MAVGHETVGCKLPWRGVGCGPSGSSPHEQFVHRRVDAEPVPLFGRDGSMGVMPEDDAIVDDDAGYAGQGARLVHFDKPFMAYRKPHDEIPRGSELMFRLCDALTGTQQLQEFIEPCLARDEGDGDDGESAEAGLPQGAGKGVAKVGRPREAVVQGKVEDDALARLGEGLRKAYGMDADVHISPLLLMSRRERPKPHRIARGEQQGSPSPQRAWHVPALRFAHGA